MGTDCGEGGGEVIHTFHVNIYKVKLVRGRNEMGTKVFITFLKIHYKLKIQNIYFYLYAFYHEFI